MLQTFQAKDLRAALSAMRSELGDEAVLLGSEKTADGNVLLRAAIGVHDSIAPPPVFASFEARYRDNLVAKLRVKPALVAAQRTAFERSVLLGLLCAHRVPYSLTETLAQEAADSELSDLCLALSAALDKRMRIEPIDTSTQAALLLLGPYGAGKTTVAAKLAAQAHLEGRIVRLVATDVDSAGQRERLETFAAHLDMSVIAAPTPNQFADAITAARRDGALLIADSAGFDPRHPSQESLAYAGLRGAEIVGVVSAGTDAEDACEMAAALK